MDGPNDLPRGIERTMSEPQGALPPSGASAPARSLPLRLAPLSLPLFVAFAAGFLLYAGGREHESALLLTVLNTLFGAGISLLIAHLAGQSYRRTGAPSHLYLGVGSLTFAIAYLLPGPLMTRAAADAVTVHNLGVLLAGACFLLSARLAMRDRPDAAPRTAPLAHLALAAGAPVALMALVLWGTLAHAIPPFLVEGRGMTPLRQVVMGLVVAEFLLAAAWFGVLERRSPSLFLAWYSLGLALLGLGLGAMIPAGNPGTPLGWVGRVGQYLGSLYLLFAVLSVERGPGGWQIPLEQALKRSEEELNSLFDLFAVGMVYGDPTTTRLLRVNERFCEMTGYSREELLELTWPEITVLEDREKDRVLVEQALRRETPGWSAVKRYRHKNGAIVWAQITGTVLFDEGGRPWKTAAIIEDVSARVLADAERERLLAEVQRSAGELDAVFKALPFLVTVIGPEGNHERVNPALVRLFGFDPAATPREEVARRLQASFPDRTPLTPQNMPSSRALRGERVDDVEYQITDGAGQRRTLVANAVPLYGDGVVCGALMAQRDVTEERRAAEKIRHLASFPELNPTPIVEFDVEGGVTFRNAAAIETLRSLGLPDDARAFLPPDAASYLARARAGEAVTDLSLEVTIGGRIFGERLQALPALGVVRVFARDLTELRAVEAERARLFERLEQAHAELERTVQERTADLIRTVRQLEAEAEGRAEAEQALRRGEERLRASAAYTRSLIDASLDPLAAITTDGTITDVNPAMEAVTGLHREQLVGRDFADFVAEPALARAACRQSIAAGFSRDTVLTIRHAEGRATEVLFNASVYRDAAGRVAGIFAAARDVTEHNATLRRLRVTSELLQLFQRVVTRQQYLDAVVGVLKTWSGCECVGIRIDDGAGRLVYEAHTGFDGQFLEHEGSLRLDRADCVCTRAALGTAVESDRVCMTPAGSFRCDDTPGFSAGLDERQRVAYRGHCFRQGFESLAAIPVRYRDQTRGLIHMADRRPGAIPPATVEFIEYLVPLIGEAIHRYDTEAELERHRAHLEDLVERRTMELQHTAAELERSNRDLEQFASAVSHDLKEPLRAMAGYASLLQSRYGEQFEGKAADYLAGTVAGAGRMQRLIDDLLSYSRVGSRGGVLRPTDAEAALAAAVANLRVVIEETGAELTHDPLPWVRSDPTQLVQLLQNLIANAVKFRGAEIPRIHVGAAREAGQWRFWVRDNGIGIDPRFRERVFEIFQRLHPRSAYPGTGIGLAICKRIAERHGGRIWVESEPGRGATFFFTVPDAGAEQR
jgi:PAS domain S-box-containing protein